jgi:hypothetical protein
MAGHANPIVRDTAEFFTDPDPVLTVDATTKRSDSPALMAKAPSGYDPRLFDAFFRGVTDGQRPLPGDGQDIGDAMGKLRDQVRWTFFLNQPAMKQYVESLPPKLANIIRERLRD